MQPTPIVSFVISTRNRCDVLLSTLAAIHRCGVAAGEFDIHVIDNASTDGTAARVRAAFPGVHLTALKTNRGSVAKNLALPAAFGKYVVFLDDDSFPAHGAIARMIRHFEADPKLGATTFTVRLPDGSQECSAYPDVFIGCGVGLRRRALRLVGGLPDDFFMQAEEYDLSLRLLDGGWKVRRFDDLLVHHLKTPQARISSRTVRLDVRNNLYLILRRFPRKWIAPYGWDWLRRYVWIAASKGMIGPFLQGLIEGVLRSIISPKRAPVSEEAFEQFAKLAQTQRLLLEEFHSSPPPLAGGGGGRGSSVEKLWLPESASSGFSQTQCADAEEVAADPSPYPLAQGEGEKRRVVLVDCGKNIHAYWRACQNLGIKIVAIADPKLARPARRYRGIRIVDDATARAMNYDAALIANLSPVHAKQRRDAWRLSQLRPVIDLFEFSGCEITSARPAGSESRQTVARSA